MSLAAIFWLHDVFHPLVGRGYQFWSGIAGSFILGGGIWVGAVSTLRRHNCHVRRCWRIGGHPVEGTPYRTCRKHHPTVPRRVSTAHIHAAHAEAREGAVKVRKGK